MLKKSIVFVTLAALALGTAALAQNPPVSPSPIKRTILSKIDLPGTNYETITATVEVAPGFKAGRHFHPGVVVGHVTEGEFWIAIDGQPETNMKAGDTKEIPNRAVHNEGNPGTVPAKLIVTYVVEKGHPMVNPVKD
jgi:quercetin dioxygenase-like cupin family protein